jgi:hypothetical protein
VTIVDGGVSASCGYAAALRPSAPPVGWVEHLRNPSPCCTSYGRSPRPPSRDGYRCAPPILRATGFTLRATVERSTDLPDGLFGGLPVQPLSQKYSCSLLTQITFISAPSRPTQRGVSRSSRARGGMRWTQAVSLTNDTGCGRRSRVVLTPRRWRQAGGVIRRRRWQTSPVTGESAKETVKTIACGNAGCFRRIRGD